MVNIATWNFHCIPVPLGCPKHHIDDVAEYAKALAEEHDLSILVLNEAFVSHARDAILRSLRKVGPWRATPSDAKGPTHVGSGVVIAWRKDRVSMVGNTHVITYNSCCQMDCLSQKGAVHAMFRTRENATFHVMSTHMQAWEIPVLCDGVRKSQIDALKSMADELRRRGTIAPGQPVIYVGDFNEPPSEVFEKGLGADHVTCVGNCQTHALGEIDNFYLQGGTREWRQTPRSRIVHATGLRNPSDHEPLMMKIQL
jgi:endonuclease/exonuclease/phosphatase family metal-dependent hydrolase